MEHPKLTVPFQETSAALQTRTFGVVSYLNARPLHEMLHGRDDVILKPAVPAALIDMLENANCDAALLPVVDFWRNRERLALVSDACIASDGQTLTVRVFSKRPPDSITHLHVDADSHTSVILAQIIWRLMYSRTLSLAPWQSTDPGSLDDVQAVLLIGDKVIRSAPLGFGFEVDLGAAWKYLTGLPFVFAAWYGAKDRDTQGLAAMLSDARDRGVADARRIAEKYAAAHGWPVETAVNYLCNILRFTLTDAMRAGMDRFFQTAVKFELLK